MVRVFNDRGACLAAARVSDGIRPGVVGSPPAPGTIRRRAERPLDKHGNPNVLTLDIGACRLTQGCTAQTAWWRSSATTARCRR